MKTTSKAYKALWKLIDKEEIHLHTLDFSYVCNRIGASEEELDKLLTQELGYTGRELLRELRHRHFSPCTGGGN
ncbi:MAG: hypothetical protein J5769_05240 [Bacteroidales bacterium]|nr:hypothetical protein [Bacteroidales bacterium]